MGHQFQNMRKYNTDSRKQGQQKVQLYCEDDSLCHSDYLIYLWLVLGSPEKGGGWSEPAYRLEYTDSEGSFYTAESVLGQRVHCVYRHLQNVVLVHEKL